MSTKKNLDLNYILKKKLCIRKLPLWSKNKAISKFHYYNDEIKKFGAVSMKTAYRTRIRLSNRLYRPTVPSLRPWDTGQTDMFVHVVDHVVAAATIWASLNVRTARQKHYERTANSLTLKYMIQFILRDVSERPGGNRSPYNRTARSTNLRVTPGDALQL